MYVGGHQVEQVRKLGHAKMWSEADLRGGTPSISFNHVIGPHFVTFSSSLYNNPQIEPYP